jgi:hypothetical protein
LNTFFFLFFFIEMCWRHWNRLPSLVRIVSMTGGNNALWSHCTLLNCKLERKIASCLFSPHFGLLLQCLPGYRAFICT